MHVAIVLFLFKFRVQLTFDVEISQGYIISILHVYFFFQGLVHMVF
jgi:hypothetical protein